MTVNRSKKNDSRFWRRWCVADAVQDCSRGFATDGPVPMPCDHEIFTRGEPIAFLCGSSNALERWVCAVAKRANARVDWHISGGIGQMLHLGDETSRSRVEQAIDELAETLDGEILQRLPSGSEGLYRAGVTETHPKAVAFFRDPLTGESTTMCHN